MKGTAREVNCGSHTLVPPQDLDTQLPDVFCLWRGPPGPAPGARRDTTEAGQTGEEEKEMGTKIKITEQIDGDTKGIWTGEDGARIYWHEGRGHETPIVINPDGTEGDYTRYETPEEWEETPPGRGMTEADEQEWEENYY